RRAKCNPAPDQRALLGTPPIGATTGMPPAKGFFIDEKTSDIADTERRTVVEPELRDRHRNPTRLPHESSQTLSSDALDHRGVIQHARRRPWPHSIPPR